MSMVVLADFFDSEAWLVTRNLVFLFLVVFWLAVGYWTYKDARRRIQDTWLVAMATLLGLVPPFIGAVIYMLFRPPEYLDEVRERELEMRALQALRPADVRCPVCRSVVEPEFLVCPVCTTRLRESCSGCKAPLDPLWQVCPFCETPVARPQPVDVAETVAPPLGERVTPAAERSKARQRRRRTAE
jgi:Double zinc ribbon